MSLKPVRFIGHKIGPFDHIELNWHEDSRSTIIVGENGTGKTTLVAAMAVCLGIGYSGLRHVKDFERFAHDSQSYAFFELELDSKTKIGSGIFSSHGEQNYIEEVIEQIKPDFDTDTSIVKGSRFFVSPDLREMQRAWQSEKNIEVLAAAYGSYRDIIHDEVTEHKEIKESPFKDILNPFAGTSKSTVPQWIANQHVLHSLAYRDGETAEAESYLSTIRRIEEFFTAGLQMPIKSQIDRNPFRLKIAQNGSQISVDQLSDGTRSFLSWALDYLSRVERINWKNPADKGRAPGLILVDEIDSHLHPEWQKRVMAASADLLPNTHIIATTHSPFVVGSADDTQLFHIVKNDDGKLEVESSYDELYGQPADIVLKELFTDSLYTPEIEKDLERLSELMGKLTFGEITSEERQEHDRLFEELSTVSPWLSNLLAMTQASQNGS